MEIPRYRYTEYGSKRRRLEPKQNMVPSITDTSNGRSHWSPGFFGFISKLFTPVTNLFRPSTEPLAPGECCNSSSDSASLRRRASKLPANDSLQRVRRKRPTDSKTSENDDVIIIEQADDPILSSLISSEGLQTRKAITRRMEDKENESGGLAKSAGGKFASTESRSSSGASISRSVFGEISNNDIYRDRSAGDETLKCLSPSPQPEHSISRQNSPLPPSAGSGIAVDRWQRRRTSSSARNSLLMNRFSPYRSFSPKCFDTNRERLFGRQSSIIDRESKERYRKFLEDAGILRKNASISNRCERRSSSRKTDYQELLHRGQSALNEISQSRSSSASTSRQGSVVTISSDGTASSLDGNRGKNEFVKHQNHVPQRIEQSESRSSSEEVQLIWDKKHRDDFNALWEEEKNTKLLAEHRLAMHRHHATLRQRRANELLIEKRLIEEARRDEELSLEEQLRRKLTLTGVIVRSRKIKRDEFPQLGDEALSLVRRVWDRKLPHNEKLSGEITRKDLLTLKGLDWLNDEIINSYMNLICERAKNDEALPKVYAFNTFFYPTLSSKGYSSVKRWTRKVDIFAHELLLVPVHLGAHWCLAVVDFTNKIIEYYDSMGGSNERCLEELCEYLCEESLDKRKKIFDTHEWKLVTREDIPQQMNGSDCGMFACKFAEYASRRAEISFTQENMPYFRERMTYELCRQKLL